MTTDDSQYLPPLFRWAGSKRKLLSDLLACMPDKYNRYVEPFAGSACLFFALRPSSAILGDLNRELVASYLTLRSHPILLCRAVSTMPQTKRFYYALRAKGATGDPLLDAARFVYLNRHCFNGVFRTNSRGEFNVPRGNKVGAMPAQQQFSRCSKALKSAELVSGDFQLVVARVEEGDFVYLDPPYAKVGARRRGEYGRDSFDTCDLHRLSAAVEEIDRKGATFLLSYADGPEISHMRTRWHSRTVSVRRHVAGFSCHRSFVDEVLISNYPI